MEHNRRVYQRNNVGGWGQGGNPSVVESPVLAGAMGTWQWHADTVVVTRINMNFLLVCIMLSRVVSIPQGATGW